MNQMPDLTGLKKHLFVWSKKSAYVVPMKDNKGRVLGNNGDELMGRVFRKILDMLEIDVLESPHNADLVIVPPSGALLEVYNFPKILRQRLIGLENTPLVIMPSSAYFPKMDPSFIFADRTAPTLWMLREQQSFEHLRSQWGDSLAAHNVELVLDHDVVASGHAFVPQIIGRTTERSPLIAARLDREATSLDINPSDSKPGLLQRALRTFARVIPYGRIYTRMARYSKRSTNRAAGIRLTNLIKSLPENPMSNDEIEYVDASDPKYATFDEYCRYVANASYVVTDRLHVGLPAAILGKRVYFVEAGYHKISGVYSQSLVNLENVTLMDPRLTNREK